MNWVLVIFINLIVAGVDIFTLNEVLLGFQTRPNSIVNFWLSTAYLALLLIVSGMFSLRLPVLLPIKDKLSKGSQKLISLATWAVFVIVGSIPLISSYFLGGS